MAFSSRSTIYRRRMYCYSRVLDIRPPGQTSCRTDWSPDAVGFSVVCFLSSALPLLDKFCSFVGAQLYPRYSPLTFVSFDLLVTLITR